MTFLLWIAIIGFIVLVALNFALNEGEIDGFEIVLWTLSIIVLIAVLGQVVLTVTTGIIGALS